MDLLKLINFDLVYIVFSVIKCFKVYLFIVYLVRYLNSSCIKILIDLF